ncbi:Dihydrolipoamide acyltransferase [Giardia duodenalis]|uniref:Dihydrolipoamide acyltransferase n=1 Tax=Giardia intestinalis TaxID=5741 RepID=V6T7E5_GIAIN|nr:Dihydrolipoamide acyltransferase [Giardia intestinalis]
MSSTGWSGNRRRNEEGPVWNPQQEGLRRVWPRAGPAQGDEAERQLREVPHVGIQRADRSSRGDARGDGHVRVPGDPHPEGVRRIPPDRDRRTVTNIFHRVLLKGWSGMPTTSHANRSPSSRTRTR